MADALGMWLSDGVFVNLAITRNGFATQATFPPNVAHVEEFPVFRQPRGSGVGPWSSPVLGVPPLTPVGRPPFALSAAEAAVDGIETVEQSHSRLSPTAPAV